VSLTFGEGAPFASLAAGDTNKVVATADDKYSATFCSLIFSSGNSSYDFTTGGNLTTK